MYPLIKNKSNETYSKSDSRVNTSLFFVLFLDTFSKEKVSKNKIKKIFFPKYILMENLSDLLIYQILVFQTEEMQIMCKLEFFSLFTILFLLLFVIFGKIHSSLSVSSKLSKNHPK